MAKFMGWLAAAVLMLSVSTPAHAEFVPDYSAMQAQAMIEAQFQGLNWKVGDKANYKLSGGFINGTVAAFVRQDTGTSFWVQQDMDLGFMGKQKVEILYNKSTGQVEKILANGQEQQIPSAKDIEVIEMKESHISVPAGSFDAIYVKIKDKKNNQEQEAWLNPQAIPISGMLKAIADSQLGKITQELTSFLKQ